MRALRGCFALFATALLVASSSAQQPSDRTNSATGNTLSIPGSDSILQITADAPEEARVGQSFDYQIQVKNVSRNVVVHNLVIAQHSPQKFEIQSSKIQNTPQQNQTQQSGQTQSKARNAGQQQQKARQSSNENATSSNAKQNQNADRAAPKREQQKKESQQEPQSQSQPQAGSDQEHQQHQGQQSQQGEEGRSRWTIERLNPGETRTISVTAISDTEGQGDVCLAIESFTPALCLSTKFTKPELEIVKQAPESVEICDEIEFVYLVNNSGTADLETFTVEDQLPEGLQTVDGAKQLKFTLEDGLKAGDTRKFVATLQATRTGEFSSRASVRGSEGVSAQSNSTTTRVQKAELAVAIEGPRAQEVNALSNYTVRVTNHGDAAAPNAQLSLFYPRSADIVRVSEPRQSSREAPQNAGAQRTNQQQAAQEPNQQERNQQQNQGQRRNREQANQQAQKQQGSQQQQAAANQQDPNQQRQALARRRWDLGTLQPGQSVEVSFALRPFEGGDLRQIAVAEYICPAAQERGLAKELFRSEATNVTEIVALPGLRITVVDSDDPVPTGENVTYTIQVANEGDAEARDVQVSAHLPEQQEFVEARGDTNAKNSQGEITFEPVQTLAPGESATWEVVVKVNEQADAAFRAEMVSADFQQPITAEEPTTLFDQGQAPNQNPGQAKQKQNQNQKKKAEQGEKKQNSDAKEKAKQPSEQEADLELEAEQDDNS